MLFELWLVLPYFAFASFLAGHLWRYRRGRFGGSMPGPGADRVQRLASTLFRCGVALVVAGRVTQLLTQRTDLDTGGSIRVVVAVVGVVAVAAAMTGAMMLLIPRLTVPSRRAAVTWVDSMTLPVLVAALISGVAADLDPTGDAAALLLPWFRSLFTAHPQCDAIATAPLLYQTRAVIVVLVIGIWPYTRLAGIFSDPIISLTRSLRRARTSPARAASPPSARTPPATTWTRPDPPPGRATGTRPHCHTPTDSPAIRARRESRSLDRRQ